MIDFIFDNKEWIFSGIGITVLAVIAWVVRTYILRPNPNKQIQVSGHNSQNIQVGGNLNLSKKHGTEPTQRG